MDVARPEDFFISESYEGYEVEQAKIRQYVESIPREPDHGLETLHVDTDEEVLLAI